MNVNRIYVHGRSLTASKLLRLDLRQQLLHRVFFFERGQTIVDIIRRHPGFRLAHGFLPLRRDSSRGRTPPLSIRRRSPSERHSPSSSVRARRCCAISTSLLFCASCKFQFELAQRGFQILHLRGLIGHLLARNWSAMFFAVIDRSSAARARSSWLLSTASSALPHPVFRGLFIFFLFLQQQMLIGDRDRHLRLHLQQLILHVQNHLFDHLFGLLPPCRSNRSDSPAPASPRVLIVP